jgi:tetratricopeptide (TPR) repeat protein
MQPRSRAPRYPVCGSCHCYLGRIAAREHGILASRVRPPGGAAIQGAVNVLDITTLLYYAAMGLALVGADAYWYADSIISKVEVSRKYIDEGLSSDFATTLFSHELQNIFSNESIVRTPDIRAANDQSVISVIAASLKLDDLTFAFQHMFGLDPVQVKVALLDDGAKKQILVTSTSRTRPPFTLILNQGAKEEMSHFVRRAALETSSRLDPYHASLFMLEKSDVVESYMPQLKTLLQQNIDALPATPSNPQRALFRNLQGITALLENDVDRAGTLFEQAVKDADGYSAAMLNLGFVRVQQDRYDEALEAVRPVIERRAQPRNPALHSSGHTISGVAHWALKRYELAERHFAEAARINPQTSDAFEYWGAMLDELGRTQEAQARRYVGDTNLAAFEQYPEVALLYFWLAEKTGQPLTRRTQAHTSRVASKAPPDVEMRPVHKPTGALLKN